MQRIKALFSKKKQMDAEVGRLHEDKWEPHVKNDLMGSLAKELTAVADTPVPPPLGELEMSADTDVGFEDTKQAEYKPDTVSDHLVENLSSDSFEAQEEIQCDKEYDVEEDYEEDEEEYVEMEKEYTSKPLRFAEQVELKGYKLIEKIGEGAFSKVYAGIPDRSSENAFLARNYKQVAVKVINKHDLDISNKEQEAKTNRKDKHSKNNRMSSREQVLKEVRIHKAASQGCPYIVGFVDFQESKRYYYIIQELLDGGEIFNEIVRLTYFSEDLTRHVIKQVALAVRHLHSMGIVHRDIKPENLLFKSIEYIPSKERKLRKSDDPATKADEGVFIPTIGGGGVGIVKLADFGLSKQIFQTNTKTPCGTIGYTAPEVVKDERYSMKVDMWGLGCVLYTMLCGFPPFYDEKIDILTEKISRGEYTFLEPWWDEISDGAKHAVRKLLEVNPENRYDIDEFLSDPWLNTFDTFKKKKEQKELEEKKKIMKRRRRKNPFEKDPSLLYSPAAVAMRDAFDISNAVQRDKETFSPGTLNLDIVQEDEMSDIDEQMFQLKLNSSTILKRRKEEPIKVNGI